MEDLTSICHVVVVTLLIFVIWNNWRFYFTLICTNLLSLLEKAGVLSATDVTNFETNFRQLKFIS